MLYDDILVDVFNLYYRKKKLSLENSSVEIARSIIMFIERDLMTHLTKEGTLFLLYDPIPKGDLGMSKAFKNTDRQEIVHSYKRNRVHDKLCLITVELVRKYFLHRGKKVVTVINSKFEADDYVEPILKERPNDHVLLVTVDEDWCRYLCENVQMMNKGFEDLFTKESFEEKYDFTPTIAGVCVWKALFGDNSDNIRGALQDKKIKNKNELVKTSFEYIQWLGKNNRDINDILKLNKCSLIDIIKKENKNPEENFIIKIDVYPSKYEIKSTFFHNLMVIRSICDDWKKCATAKEVSEKDNRFIENFLGFNKEEKTAFRFGGIKAK